MEQSAIRGLYSGDYSQYLKITKWAIQKYLEQCIHPEGQFRPLFKRFATFTTHFVLNEVLDNDPDKRILQIARYFEGVREAPPQIFIQDGGYEYVPSSLGGLVSGNNMRFRGEQVVRIMDVIPIPIEITCAALSEQEVEDLISFVSLSMSSMMKFTCNYYIRPAQNTEGIYSEVRVPLGHNVGVKSNTALHGDPKDQMWSCSINMTVEFENSTYIKYTANPKFVPGVGEISLSIPSTIPLIRKTMFSIQAMPYPVRVYSDDSRVAIIQQTKTHYVVCPKRTGTFKIIVAKGQTEISKTVVTEKEITVVVR